MTATPIKKIDIPGYDAEEDHGFSDCDSLETWLGDNGFECIFEAGYKNIRSWWSESAGILVLTMPFWIAPELGEFKVFDAPTYAKANSITSSEWEGLGDDFDE